MDAQIQAAIGRSIASALGHPFAPRECVAIGGGCINRAFRLTAGDCHCFVKLNRADAYSMFEAEADALRVLAAAGAVRVPRVICTGASLGHAWLVLEHIALGGPSDMPGLGRQLAAMHRHLGPGFGWHADNFIGASPQQNGWTGDWAEFWRTRRLGPQLDLAKANGNGARLSVEGERLLSRIDALLDGHRPAAALLHGDLWGGNAAFASDGTPVIFDPAAYYGDREADLAMTELFGGFSPAFYAAYREAWPLDGGYPLRRDLYNLYHLLNHLNLFGGGYLGQCLGAIDRLLRAS